MRRSAKGAKSFAALNAGKKKVRLDITAAEERARSLARGANVFVDNLRPGIREARGLGYKALKAVNPRLIYCSISGFGRTSGGVGAFQ
jgi:crotonobetainyl-CoA:carnitine CoA-transferase CaiB-like acyl-CoA transferase